MRRVALAALLVLGLLPGVALAAAGRLPLGQIPGVSADRAWKRSIGRPDVRVAILDTGIRWGEDSLRPKVALNGGELPTPQ
jgi:hypothetical protein